MTVDIHDMYSILRYADKALYKLRGSSNMSDVAAGLAQWSDSRQKLEREIKTLCDLAGITYDYQSKINS